MLGWLVCIYRQTNSGTLPATNTQQDEGLIAKWQTGLGGLDWLNQLVNEGKAIEVAGNNGYPIRYTATSKYIIPYIVDNPPNAMENWIADEGDVLLPSWTGRTEINKIEIDKCRPDEWLLIETWDES
jgi:hypothetical protein